MNRKKDVPSIYTGLRIPPDLRERAQKKAKRDGRTLSNYIKYLIRRDLGIENNGKEHGPL